ncbi:MAG: DNA internalization-related competence protein ComEC/Rec2 [Cycloclasticus sp.]|nr:DNA internalization-related competence protein ComEC/Rec2 [Cycloclasticus sp.]MBQ0789702.1 DNA internalization-related competence protein ComEC/Rec2 [Cycloclasticus sp.]
MKKFQLLTVFFSAGVSSILVLDSLPENNSLFFTVLLLLLVFRWLPGLSFFIAGFLWATIYAVSVADSTLGKQLEGEDVLLEGQIIDLPRIGSRSTQFFFQVDRVVRPQYQQSFPIKIKLNWYGQGIQLRSSEKWQLLVKLKRPHGLANPHGFDYEKFLFQQQIGATGYVRQSVDNRRVSEASPYSIGYWREALRDRVDQALPNSAHSGVIKALLLGDRAGISQQQWSVFRKTGTSHLIAISGLHIGLVSALVFGLVRWLGLRFRLTSRRLLQYSIVAGFMAALIYAAFAGFAIPTKRALIMLFVIYAGIYWQRYYSPFHIISLALIAVLFYDPLSIMSAGFWLSFAAVAVILFMLVGRFKRPRSINQMLRLQLWISVGLLPLVLYFFQQVSLVSPLANVLAVPWVSFAVVPLLLLVLPLGLISDFLAINGLLLIDGLIAYLWVVLQVLADFKYAYLQLPNVSLWACLLALLGAGLALLPKGLLAKPVAYLFFIPLFLPMKTDGLHASEFKLILLDVGQGLSAIIHTKKHTLVFDTGAKYNEKSDLASTVVLPYLRAQKIEKIDALVLSHGDNDHAGGAETLIQSIAIERVLSSVTDRFKNVSAQRCEQGMAWQWDGVSFEFLSPHSSNLFSGNNASCVLKVSSVNGSVLLPADIEKPMEQSLLQYFPDKLKADVLIAPHHGSKTSSTPQFIKAVSPRFVLFPVGYKNRFGFPKPEVLSRYKKQGVEAFSSAQDGALSVSFNYNKPIQVERYRPAHRSFWSWQQ